MKHTGTLWIKNVYYTQNIAHPFFSHCHDSARTMPEICERNGIMQPQETLDYAPQIHALYCNATQEVASYCESALLLLKYYNVCRSEVVVLQFSHERRDRRKREYVMIEQNHDSIIEILAPISKNNQKAFSLASKVEVHLYIHVQCTCTCTVNSSLFDQYCVHIF